MALTIGQLDFQKLSNDELAKWRQVPAAIIGDELNRTCTMQAAIKPVRANVQIAAQALTIQCMVGDNAPLHHGAVCLARLRIGRRRPRP